MLDAETSLARETCVGNEMEIKARQCSRRLMQMKYITLQKLKENPEESKEEVLIDFIEESINLQLNFQQQFEW